MKILHIVQKNDTLCKIAKLYNVSIIKLAEDNGITNVDFIKERDCLIVEVEE